MVNKNLDSIGVAVEAYVVVTVATLAALAVLEAAAPHLATREAWGHAAITTVFAVVLPLRMRSARNGLGTGRRSGLTAVGLIGAVLFLVNLVGALVPGFYPGWMRVEMVGIAALLLGLVLLVVRVAVQLREAVPAG